MGQYYHPISLERKESVYSHDYNNGLKLMEHSWIGNEFVNVVENLIAEGGLWYGTRLVWAGDYADPEIDEEGNVIQYEYDGKMYDKTLYDMYGDNKIKPTFDKKIRNFRYVINMDTKEFVDMKKVPLCDTWIDPDTKKEYPYYIHPLPLLTCEGNGRGGGDYHKESPLIGSWARNRVTVSTRKPKGYKEIIFDLVE